ncbi:MAG: hypothetical protein HN742_21530 [Lentisphaerae bacterium]|jgi:hypothetical protein|nr:hypothetical protein [Lentisphaerota bacterium]MBT4816741.1 hypothetical protein [Lentisphaerota bacterium]MBT5613084.1 hypothetical protein [Lentisphaerota bacterium]MBT7056444.1 hypothetical protein [Lentisphaerota bacterium]MBT7844473.1 hypothetical protein [Lentisphaerota bacterium]
MAVTAFQTGVLRLLAAQRRERGESYVAGGVALNALLAAPRRSRDIDLFHDTTEALNATWVMDRNVLTVNGYEVRTVREARTFVEASVSRGDEGTAVQWVRDSAYRFFPLIEDDLMGLTLHPFDLATNKVLALVGRLEVRDWVDVLNCDRRLQPLGYLAWAACGKDPGYNPHALLALAARHHYSQPEVDALDFEGDAPDASAFARAWHKALASAASICERLPVERVGTCVVSGQSDLFRGDAAELKQALREGSITFHDGRIGGSWPSVA